MTIRIVKGLWIVGTITVLLVTLYAYDGKPNSDIEVLLAWAMIFLSFPSGLIFAGLFSLVADSLNRLFNIVIHTSYVSLVLSWMGFLLLGYLQWFKLIPWLVRKFQARIPTESKLKD